MNKRENIIQKFSTFLSFGDKNSGKFLLWQADPRLERQMQGIAKTNLDAQADFWARYFLKIAKGIYPISDTVGENTSQFVFSSVMAGKHLSAYLQEACLWTAQKLYRKLTFLRHKYSIEEYFQIGNSVANPPAKILGSFNFEYPQANIEGYAKTIIIRAVKNQIYQQDVEAKRTKFSDYGLLKDLSNKELKESLAFANINQQQMNLYCLVCQCFNEIYQPSDGSISRSLEAPNQTQIQDITSCYNQRCSQLNWNIKLSTPEEIQEILITCIRLAREYRTRRFVPLEDKDKNVTDFKPNLLDIVIEEEERNEIYLLVYRLFTELSDISQVILTLWLGLNLTQTEIAMVLQDKYPELQKQYQIARQLGKISKILLKNFINEWNQVNPENLINDDKNTEYIKESLMNCLQLYCQRRLVNLLTKIKNQFNRDEKVLILAKNNDSSMEKLTKIFKNSTSEVSKRRVELRQSLELAFENELESTMHLNKNSLFAVKCKISEFINNNL